MFYIGMFFFALAIASGLWGFAGVGVEVDLVARLIFYASLLAASVTFVACLMRTAARGRNGASNDGGRLDAAVGESGAASTAAPDDSGRPGVWRARHERVSCPVWRAPADVNESWSGSGPVRTPGSASRANGSVGQEV